MTVSSETFGVIGVIDVLEEGEFPCPDCSLLPICMPSEDRFLDGAGPKPRKPLPSLGIERVLYVDEQGAYLRVDGVFRQTGLQENEARWTGITRFKYYGELLDPELSNLTVVTVGLGLRPTNRSSLDLVYHEYRQDTASTALRSAALAAGPSGLSRQLERELDLVVGYDGVAGIEVKGVFSYFIPGQAFPRADGSVFASVQVEWTW